MTRAREQGAEIDFNRVLMGWKRKIRQLGRVLAEQCAEQFELALELAIDGFL